MLIVVLDILTYLGIGAGIAGIWWPISPPVSVVFICLPIVFLIYAWYNAHHMVAARAGFSRPSLVQGRYLDHLGTVTEVWTSPSPVPVVALVASSRHRLALLTNGALEDLTDDDLHLLIERLESRNHRSVFYWTYHLATHGIGASTSSLWEDITAAWWRIFLFAAAVFALMVTTIIMLSSTIMWPAADKPPIEPAFLPFGLFALYFVLKYLWSLTSEGFSHIGAAGWNDPIEVSVGTFWPVSNPEKVQQKLRFLQKGLIWLPNPKPKDEGRTVDEGADMAISPVLE